MSSPPPAAAGSAAADDPQASWRATHLSYLEWSRSVPALYDLCMSYGLTWPSLSAQWLPTEPITHEASGCVTHQMLIGTYTQPGFPNFIQLAQVTLPDRSRADPMAEFMRHPLARAINAPASAAAASSAAASSAAAASSSAAAAPAASSYTASALDDLAAEYRPDCSYYRRGALKLVHKVRASQELHRIRPFAPSFSTRNLSASSLTESARDTQGRREGTASSSQRCLAAAKGPESHVKIYDVCSGASAAAAAATAEATSNSFVAPIPSDDGRTARKARSIAVITASMGSKERDSALLTLTGHITGGWALDWNTVGANAQAGLLVSGDDEGGICVWSLEDAQTSLCTPPLPSSLQLSNNGGATADASSASAVPAASSSPMQRLQKQQQQQTLPRTSPHFPSAAPAFPTRSASGSSALHSVVPTLAPRAQWASAHGSSVINDISWLRTGCAHTFLSVSDDRTMRRWDCRDAAGAAASVSSTIVHASVVTSLSPCPFNEHWVLTAGGADKLVKLWDLRSMRAMDPVHEFKAHGNEVSQVTWAPFASAERGKSVFASSGKDRRIMLWDASLIHDSLPAWDLAESGPPELIFTHAGHTGDLIEDFCWHPSVPWLLASVGSENVLQVWEPFEALRTPTDLDAGAESKEEQQVLQAFTEMLTNPSTAPDPALGGAVDPTALLSFVAASPALQNHAVTSCVAHDLATHPSVAPVMQFVGGGGYQSALTTKLQSLDRSELRAMQGAMDTSRTRADSDADEGDDAAASPSPSPVRRNARGKNRKRGRRDSSRMGDVDSSADEDRDKDKDSSSRSSRDSSPAPALRSPVAAPPPPQVSKRGRALKKTLTLIQEQSQQEQKQQQQQQHQPSTAAATSVVHASIKLDAVQAKLAIAKAQNGATSKHSNGAALATASAPFSSLPSNWQTLLRNVQRHKLPASGAATDSQRAAFDKALAALLAAVPEQATAAVASTPAAASAAATPGARPAATRPAPAARGAKKAAPANAASSSSTSSDEPSSDDDELLITPSPQRKRARAAAAAVVAPPAAAAASSRSPTRKTAAAAAAASASPAVVSPSRKSGAAATAAATVSGARRVRSPPRSLLHGVTPRFYISRTTDESIFLRDKLVEARKKVESKLSYESPADRKARVAASAALRKPKGSPAVTPTPTSTAHFASGAASPAAVTAAAAAAASPSPPSLLSMGLMDMDDESKEQGGGGGGGSESVGASSVKSEPGLCPTLLAPLAALPQQPEPIVKLEPITTASGAVVSARIALRPVRARASLTNGTGAATTAATPTPSPASTAASPATPMQME